MKNYKKEIMKFVNKYAYNANVKWNKIKRELVLTINGRDGTECVIREKTYASLEISKNLQVYLDDTTTANFCGKQ